MLKDDFFTNLDFLLKVAEEDDTDDPKDNVIGDLDTAKDEATKNEELPPLGEGEDILDPGNEEPFGPALSPSSWELNKSGDGYIVFVKKDSQADKEAARGRYQKQQLMNTGKPDEAIINYINVFLSKNNIDTSPQKHLTMKTPFGPKITDEYDNDVSVVREWKNGKYTTTIKWRPKDATIQVPDQFKKEVEIPDEFSDQPAPAENMPEITNDEIPSLDEIEEETPEENKPEDNDEESTETTPEETEEVNEDEPEEENEDEEKEEKTPAFLIPHLIKISSLLDKKFVATKDPFLRESSYQIKKIARSLIAADDDEVEEDPNDAEEKPEDEEVEEEPKDEEVKPDDDEVKEDVPEDSNEEVNENVPPSADVTEIVNNILSTIKDGDKTIFQTYLEDEALQTGVLYPRDFKDIEKYRNDNDTDKLRDKEQAMADRIYSDIDRILKSEAANKEIKDKISAMSKSELLDIITDNIELVSSEDTEGILRSDINPEDIANAPLENEPEEVTEDEAPEEQQSPIERLIDIFYQQRGSLSPLQRRKITDMELFENAIEQFKEDFPDDELKDDDITKAKQLVSRDLEGRGDLTGNP